MLALMPSVHPNIKSIQEIFNKLHEEGAPGAKPWNGNISNDKSIWLKRELASAKAKNFVCNVLLLPLYPEGSLWNDLENKSIIEAYSNEGFTWTDTAC